MKETNIHNKKTREYHKKKPKKSTEYTTKYRKNKSIENKEFRLFIPKNLANNFTKHCQNIKKSRSEIITSLIKNYTKRITRKKIEKEKTIQDKNKI